MLDEYGLAGKLFLPAAIVTAAAIMPTAEPAPIVVEVADWPEYPTPEVTVDLPDFPEWPTIPQSPASNVTVQPAEPVVVEETVEVEKRVEVPVDREVIVEVPVEVRTCLVWDELPSWDLSRAISVTRPGESWSLSGDYYPGLVWHDSTPKPTETELIAGWIEWVEAETC